LKNVRRVLHIDGACAWSLSEVGRNALGAGDVQEREENELIAKKSNAGRKLAFVLLWVRIDGIEKAKFAWGAIGKVRDAPWATTVTTSYYTSKPVLTSRRRMNSFGCHGRAGQAGPAAGCCYLFENIS
jgi:hypothetical protein